MMFRMFKFFSVVLGIVMLGVILSHLAKSNSAKLSLHRASLSCVYTDMNALGAKYYDDLRRSQYYIQLRCPSSGFLAPRAA